MQNDSYDNFSKPFKDALESVSRAERIISRELRKLAGREDEYRHLTGDIFNTVRNVCLAAANLLERREKKVK